MTKKTIYLILFAMLFALSSFKKMPVIKDAAKIKTDSTVQSKKTIPQITFSEIARLSRNEIYSLFRNDSANILLLMGANYLFPYGTCFLCHFAIEEDYIYTTGFYAEDDTQPRNIKILPDYNPYNRPFLIANDFEKLRKIQYKETIFRITYYH